MKKWLTATRGTGEVEEVDMSSALTFVENREIKTEMAKVGTLSTHSA